MRSLLAFLEAGQGEEWIGRSPFQHELSDVFANRGAVFETVTGASTYQPHVLQPWMSIEYEVQVRTVLVLTDPRLEKRCSFEARESELHMVAGLRQRCRGVGSFTVGGIEKRASAIVGYLEPSRLVSWNAVEDALAVIDPYGKIIGGEAMVAGGRTEEENLLSRRMDAISQDVWEEPTQPRATGKDELVAGNGSTVREENPSQLSVFIGLRFGHTLTVFTFLGEETFEHHGAGPACQQVARVFLLDRPTDALEMDLGKSSFRLGRVEHLESKSDVTEYR